MDIPRKNYYGSLCTEMYEILHEKAPEEELAFYLSYARKGDRILEALCGSGRFLVPMLEQGYEVSGLDLSGEMLDKLKEKAPGAKVTQGDILDYDPGERFDYIFISSGSVSLFTDMALCKKILKRIKDLLAPGGVFVFAVDTVGNRCPEDEDYQVVARGKTREGLDLLLKSKNHYDEDTQTQFSPGIYELYREGELLQREFMDFQTHLYRFGEMEECLKELGFDRVKTYASFDKEPADRDENEMFLFECGRGDR